MPVYFRRRNSGRLLRFIASRYSLDSSCTVFQSELYAIYKATLLAKSSRKEVINILSDSKSTLDLLRKSQTTHPLANAIKQNIGSTKADGRDIRLFWIRAHVGTVGNERADELAKQGALTNSVHAYDKIPLCSVKETIRKETVCKWQDRYQTSTTGAITKTFWPDIKESYPILRKIKTNPTLTQVFTGHGGIAEYLYRFHIKDSPGCECDPNINETIWHVLLECPRYAVARQDLETKMYRNLAKSELPKILADSESRPAFLTFAEKVFRNAAKRNSTFAKPSNHQPIQQREVIAQIEPMPPANSEPNTITIHQLLSYGEKSNPGIRIRGVALFMNSNHEKLGISFCVPSSRSGVAISQGLAALINGSTSRQNMKRKAYEALPVTKVAGIECRLLRKVNKTIVLIEWKDVEPPYAQASCLLSKFGEPLEEETITPRTISVDAMILVYEKAEVSQRIGILKASKHHEVVVYEDRGENLQYLRPHHVLGPTNPPDNGGDTELASKSGSERLQERAKVQQQAEALTLQLSLTSKSFMKAIRTAVGSMVKISRTPPGKKVVYDDQEENLQYLRSRGTPKPTSPMAAAMMNFMKIKIKTNSESTKPQKRTKAKMGIVSSPCLRLADGPLNHFINAFLEFQALTKATKQANSIPLQEILQAYKIGNRKFLELKLREADAAIYNNQTAKIIHGTMAGEYMAAYNATSGFVMLDKTEMKRTGKTKYATPSNDPIVVTAQCTKIMLEDMILDKARTLTNFEAWTLPILSWVNGVPGCGKTTWIISHFDAEKDVIVTTTTEAAKDLREKISQRIGEEAKNRVRTLASVLVNGFKESESYHRLVVDEALMNHFGAIAMATRLSGADEILLVGDVNQLPYIDRDNLFEMRYCRPTLVTSINQELLCTHRNPLDVAYALEEVYSGIYSSRKLVQSLTMLNYTGSKIPRSQPNTLYLVHTQEEKTTLSNEGYGSGEGSRILTIHEAQGLTFGAVFIINTRSKMPLHDSVPHAVVAVSRHTESCVYFTDSEDDATGRFIRRAMKATKYNIIEYNTKMAIKDRNFAIVETLLVMIDKNRKNIRPLQ